MNTFKGYDKQATSDAMMRIDKRERILSCVLGGAWLEKLPKHDGKNIVLFSICEHESNKDYFDWKVKMLKETQWLSNFKTWKKKDLYIAQWSDTRKLRIYHKWLHRSGKRTYERVLKYMYSPLFAAIMVMDRGALNQSKELVIDLGLNYGESADLMKVWFKDILDISTEVVRTRTMHYLSFDHLGTKKLLSSIKPIVKDIPSMYEKLYPAAHALQQDSIS
ncbi:hypothetical protein MOB78_13030 [Bacillus spizizenii]|nr:hypothetical protein [Bacillus spizizenii]